MIIALFYYPQLPGCPRLPQPFFHYIMRDGHFIKFIAGNDIPESFVKSDNRFSCMHDQCFIAPFPGNIFSKVHEGGTHSFLL